MFFFKNHAENKEGGLVPDLFVFLETFIWGKASTPLLISMCLDGPSAYNENETVWNFRLLGQRYTQSRLFRKGSGKSFSTTFYVWLFKKIVSHVMSY